MRAVSALLLLLVALPLAGCMGSTEGARTDAPTGSPAPVDVSLEHSFAAGETKAHAFVVPEHARSLRVAASISNCAQTQDNLRVVVRDPAGTVVLDLRRTDGNLGVGVVGACAGDVQDGVHPDPGTWTVEFSGRGVGTGLVTVQN